MKLLSALGRGVDMKRLKIWGNNEFMEHKKLRGGKQELSKNQKSEMLRSTDRKIRANFAPLRPFSVCWNGNECMLSHDLPDSLREVEIFHIWIKCELFRKLATKSRLPRAVSILVKGPFCVISWYSSKNTPHSWVHRKNLYSLCNLVYPLGFWFRVLANNDDPSYFWGKIAWVSCCKNWHKKSQKTFIASFIAIWGCWDRMCVTVCIMWHNIDALWLTKYH